MTGMGRPKHFTFPKYYWTTLFVLAVIGWLIAGYFR